MTNKPMPSSPAPINMRPGASLPGRKPGLPPQAKSSSASATKPQIDVEKLDPATFGIGKRKSPEQELLENAEPIDLSAPQPAPRAAAPEIERKPEPPVEAPKVDKKSYLDEALSDSLISRLVEEYGFEPTILHERQLAIPNGKSLKVHFRSLSWDDYSWALAAVQRLEKEEQKNGVLFSDTQRAQTYQALSACRCVLKLADTWVWDIFELRDEIMKVQPKWTGDSPVGVPDFFIGTMTNKLFDLFRKKLHPDLLFALDDAVRSMSANENSDEDKSENPTQAT